MQKKILKIQGIVTPSEWAEDASIKAVSVATNDEQEYFVKGVGKGRDFLQLTEKVVRVEGLVTKNRRGENLIEVRDYSVI